MLGLSFTEILIVTAVALVAIGPKKLPGVAKALGRGFVEFKSAMDDMRTTVYKEVQQPMEETKSQYLDDLLEERKKHNAPKDKSEVSVVPEEEATPEAEPAQPEAKGGDDE